MSAEEVSLDTLRAALAGAEGSLLAANEKLQAAQEEKRVALRAVNDIRFELAKETTKLLDRVVAGADRYTAERRAAS